MHNFAIKGDVTRNEDIQKILEEFGGVNHHCYSCDCDTNIYYIDPNTRFINFMGTSYMNKDLFMVFSLEEFEQLCKFKRGDKVYINKYSGVYKISGFQWDGFKEDIKFFVLLCEENGCNGGGWYFSDELKPYREEYCEETQSAISTEEIAISSEELEKVVGFSGFAQTIEKPKNNKIIFDTLAPDETELILGEKFELIEVDGVYKVIRKKPKYPTTINEVKDFDAGLPSLEILKNFRLLIKARNAWWKIYREDTGDKGGGNDSDNYWEPPKNSIVYNIVNCDGKIRKQESVGYSHILEFPTIEMRDNFFIYFKDLIYICRFFIY